MITDNLSKYKHKFTVRVRNFQVDSQGIVHNAIYLEYSEIGRMEYARELGFHPLPDGVLENGVKVVVKRNEVTYHNPARLDDLIDIYTRVSYLKNSSFCFEHILMNPEKNLLLVDQKSVHVNLNPDTNIPERIPDNFRKAIFNFEGKELEIIKD